MCAHLCIYGHTLYETHGHVCIFSGSKKKLPRQFFSIPGFSAIQKNKEKKVYVDCVAINVLLRRKGFVVA